MMTLSTGLQQDPQYFSQQKSSISHVTLTEARQMLNVTQSDVLTMAVTGILSPVTVNGQCCFAADAVADLKLWASTLHRNAPRVERKAV